MRKRGEKKGKKLNLKLLIYIFCTLIVCILLIIALLSKNTDIKIVFDTDGGSQLNNVVLEKSGKIIKPNDPIKEGYIFEGWFVGDEEFDFDKPITKAVVLVAKWKKTEDVNEEKPDELFTVRFNSNGGSSVESIEVEKGNKINEPNSPTKDGYSFVSWQLDGKDYDFDNNIEKSITLIAKWEKKTSNSTSETIKHRVTFDSKGGTSISSKLVTKGTTVNKPTNPTRSGYKFLGWYYNNRLFNFSTKIYDNITLIAKWESTVTYSISWVKIESSSIGQYTLYIRSSEGKNVAGKAKITTSAGNTSVEDIPATGKIYIKSAVSNATVESVN